MRSSMTAVSVAAAALCVGLGCGGVLSTGPVGGEPVAIDEAEWKGTWLNEEGVVEIRVVGAAEGRLELGWIESGGRGFELHTQPLELRRLEDWTIGSAWDEDEEGYLWLRVARDGERLLGWLPDDDRFAALVSAGELPGSVEEGLVVLGPLTPEHLRRIRHDPGLFVWDEPLVLRRLSDGG